MGEIRVNVTAGKSQKVTVSSQQTQTEILASADMGKFWSQKSKNWAVSESLVDGTDYSSKYYANKAKENANTAKSYSDTVKSNYENFVAESEGVAELDYTYFSLSSVYRNFDGDADAVGQGAIAITYDADNNLIVLIRDYDQPPFGELWWDPGYEPDMFSFASRFVKAE